MGDALTDHLRRRLVGVGLVTDWAGEREVRQTLNDLNHRVRYALGEYNTPSGSPASRAVRTGTGVLEATSRYLKRSPTRRYLTVVPGDAEPAHLSAVLQWNCRWHVIGC